jgi:hypothetical protein
MQMEMLEFMLFVRNVCAMCLQLEKGQIRVQEQLLVL